ncbi:MAG: chemotaxis protein CheW [Acidobacteriota bacterium]
MKIRKKARKAKEESASALVAVSAAGEGGVLPRALPDESPVAAVPASVPVTAGASPEIQTGTKLDRFKETAGRRRVVAVTGQDGSAVEQLELLTFIVAGEQYAVDIERIVEIVTPRPITRIPNADRSIVGIVSLRGAIVTLLNVRHKLRHGARVTEDDPRIIVVDQMGETVGFEVDRVLRVVKVDATAVDPHPVVHASEQDEAVRGVFRQGSALTILLDLDKLLTVA